MYALYSVLIVTFFLIMSPYLAWQAVRYRKYIGSLGQRLGYLPISFNLDAEESIWIHAVSVGEVLTARAGQRGSVLHAERGVGAPDHRNRRGSRTGRRHRQPQIRLARAARLDSGRPRAQSGASVLPHRERSSRHHRRQHAERRGGA